MYSLLPERPSRNRIPRSGCRTHRDPNSNSINDGIGAGFVDFDGECGLDILLVYERGGRVDCSTNVNQNGTGSGRCKHAKGAAVSTDGGPFAPVSA